MSTATEEAVAIQLVTKLGEDVLALEIANKALENSGLMLQLPGLVRTYEIISADMARVLRELELMLD